MGKAGIQRLCEADRVLQGSGMLSAITARSRSAEMYERLERRLFTITVGAKPASHAQYVADSSSDILSLLEMLREEHR